MIINKELILKIFEEQINEEWNFDNFNLGDSKYSFKFELASKILSEKFLERVEKIYSTLIRKFNLFLKNSDYELFVTEKVFSFYFLKYIFSNIDFYFDTSQYYPSEDDEEILKFFKNLVYIILHHRIKEEDRKKILDLSFEFKFYKMIKSWKGSHFSFWKIRYNDKIYFYPYILSVEVFYFNHGLKELPKKVLNRLEGGTFVDCGVCKGDSILVFQQYKPKKIIGFEPDEKNYKDAKSVIHKDKINNIIFWEKKNIW